MRLPFAPLSALLLGCGLGLFAFTFHHHKGTSYLSGDSQACTNCHVMQPRFQSWQRSTHRAAAGCTDCHFPSDVLSRSRLGLERGVEHAAAFALDNYREPIELTKRSAAVLQAQCLHCHGETVHGFRPGVALQCVHCHAGVGHGPTPR